MNWQVIEGDCVEAMSKMAENSVDAIVTDPPYGLEFMGKEWDKLGRARALRGATSGLPVGPGSGRGTNPVEGKPGFDLSLAAQTAMQEWHYRWAIEALRVLKPGGHLLAFGGTRTYHRLACALEDAGFEIRDQLQWLYGSGFPKSLDVSKAIDKMAGAEREVTGKSRTLLQQQDHPHSYAGGWKDKSDVGKFVPVTAPATDVARHWNGWGTALKPAHEPIVKARKPLSEPNVAQNVLGWGTGALNIDGCRISSEPWARSTPYKDDIRGGAFHSSKEEKTYEVGPQSGHPSGRWPANILLSHSPDCVEVGTRIVRGDPREGGKGIRPSGFFDVGSGRGAAEPSGPLYGDSEQPVYACVPGCPVRMLDEQSGVLKSGYAEVLRRHSSKAWSGGWSGNDEIDKTYGDFGGASRFFYVAKASRAEREAGLLGFIPCVVCGGLDTTTHVRDGRGTDCIRNGHPTVKTVELMRYLCRMVTPPNGLILDPFAGSGSTGVAALQEGFRFVGIEKEAEYAQIARRRIETAIHPAQPKVSRRKPERAAVTKAVQSDLFA